jgi:SAM-dependent methyltransferase/predicted Ser/Thr protein kinase
MIFTHCATTETAWEAFVKEHVDGNAELVAVSISSSQQRIYRAGERIHKIRAPGCEAHPREQDLYGEYQILRRLSGIRGVAGGVEHFSSDKWEMLSCERVDGKPLQRLVQDGARPGISMLWRIFRLVLAVNLRGVAHRDLRPDNILIDRGNRPWLIDFDQAAVVGPWRALLTDLSGLWPGRLSLHSMLELVKLHRIAGMLLRPLSWFRRLFIKVPPADACPSGQHQHSGGKDERLQSMRTAWQIAARAGANAPGQSIAYYSIDVLGEHFPGERPWILRWHHVARRVDFRGKRVLELGCNLGMFSAFAARSGARACMGVDHSHEILEAARLIAHAFGAECCSFKQIDFDDPGPWEASLDGYDLVLALSVANWVKNRSRFMAFLGRHRELIFEGHDDPETELRQLHSAGFDHVELLAMTERGRQLYYASKSVKKEGDSRCGSR